MDLYTAQRTNFQPSAPRLAGKPGQQRQTTKRSANRGQATPGGVLPPATRPMTGKKPGSGVPANVPGGVPPKTPGKPMTGKKPGGSVPPRMPGGVPPKTPGGVKRPMPNLPGGVDAQVMPGGVVGKKKGDMSMMKKMAAFKPTGA